MDYKLSGKDGLEIASGKYARSNPLILRVDDGDAFLQIEISQSKLQVSGDGGATRRGTWELDLVIPRVNEK